MNNRLDFEKPVMELETKIQELRNLASDESMDISDEIEKLEKRLVELKKETFEKLSPWQRTQLARHPLRPYTLDYINLIMEEFTELAGDRLFGNDRAIVGGVARLNGNSVVVFGHQKGRDTKENLDRNFGMSHPEGYRKVLRLMKLAEKFKLPVIAFIDTPGAYPGIGAEERGQAEAIARNLRDTARLKTPIIVVVIGEGGSGGALGLGLGNRILMLENSVYFVCTPEACGAILWKDRNKAPYAAEALGITAKDLYNAGVVDEIIPEPLEGAHRDHDLTAANVKKSLEKNLADLKQLSVEQILETRYDKYRKMGKYTEEQPSVTSEQVIAEGSPSEVRDIL
jgi:acetyl-CoA carboxylase carboxyl transferase subunit alpha